MQEKHLILIVLVLTVLARALVAPLPINEDITTGADQAVYLLRGEVLHGQGWINWDETWYGGYPFLTFYPPLSFYLLSWLSNAVSLILSFKILTFLAFVVTPPIFYMFLKEFRLSTEQRLWATAIFSFIMYFNAFVFLGQYPSLLAIPLGLLFLKFFISGVRDGKKKSLFISSLLLAGCILTQQIVSFMSLFIAGTYLLSHLLVNKDWRKVKQGVFSWVLSIAMSAFWLIPTLLESKNTSTFLFYGGINGNSALYAIPLTGVLQLFGGLYINAYTIILSGLGCILALIGFVKLLEGWKKDQEKMFWILLPILSMIGYVIAYTVLWGITPFPPARFVILWGVFLSVLMAFGMTWRPKITSVLAVIVVIMELVLFLGMPMPMQTPSEYTKFDSAYQYLQGKEGRFSFQPQTAPYNKATVMDYRPMLYGLESELGIFGIALPGNRMQYIYESIAFDCSKIIPLADRITDLTFLNRYYIRRDVCKLQNAPEEYFYLQNVKYVIVDKKFPEVMLYFNSKPDYLTQLATDDYVIYEFFGTPGFVDAPGLQSSYTKEDGKITIILQGSAQNAHVRLSESWYPFWTSNEVSVIPDEHGYISFDTDVSGSKTVTVEYKQPDYYKYFWWLSIIAFMAALLLLIKNIIS